MIRASSFSFVRLALSSFNTLFECNREEGVLACFVYLIPCGVVETLWQGKEGGIIEGTRYHPGLKRIR